MESGYRQRVPSKPGGVGGLTTINIKKTLALCLTLLGVFLLAGCQPNPARPAGAEASPHLSAGQKELLRDLKKRSSRPLVVEVWERGGTVSRLDLAVPSGADRAAPPEEHALAFVKAYAPLWKLASLDQVRVQRVEGAGGSEGAGGAAGDCTSVVLQLVHPRGLPVFNAVLGVGVTREGVIRGAAGRLTGEDIPLAAAKAAINADRAKQVLLRHLGGESGKSGESGGLPDPAEVVLDPFFLGDSEHRAVRAWLFTAPTPSPDAAGPFVVDQRTGTVAVSAPAAPAAPAVPAVPAKEPGPSPCPGDPVVRLPEVVVDRLTGTPAYVGLGPMGGIATRGATPADRAYDALSTEIIARMYGTLNPRKHLRDPAVSPVAGGGVRIRFRQYFENIPVEGAYVSVTLTRGGAAESIHSRFVYFPLLGTAPGIKAGDAEPQAFAEYVRLQCGKDRTCADNLTGRRPKPAPPSLAILSSRILQGTAIPAGQERLAWKFVYPGRIVYWHAGRPGGLLFDVATTLSHNLPFAVRNLEQGDRIEAAGNGGGAVATTTPHPDATAVAGMIPTLDGFLAGLGRHSYDDAEGRLTVHVRWAANNAVWCTQADALIPCAADEMALGRDFVAGDIVAHEFTHGVTAHTANLIYSGEPGGLNESYSDVMGNLAFPDGTPGEWRLGEGSRGGAVRDMENPAAHGQPAHAGFLDPACLDDQDRCVHTWSGVPNLAAVHIADGGIPGDPAPGLGRDKLARLYFNTLTGGALGDSALFLNQRLATVAECRNLARNSPLPGGLVFTPADCDHVARSFDAVGVNATPIYGWTRFSTGLFGTGYDVSLYAGQHLFRGCTIADQVLRAWDRDGAVRTSNTGQGLHIDMPGWGTYVTFRGAAADPTDRAVTYRVWSDWFHQGVVDLAEQYNRPAGVGSDLDCLAPPPATPSGPERHTRVLYSTTRVSEWATFFNGKRGDTVVNDGRSMPAGCEIQSVLGLEDHRTVTQPPPVTTLDHDVHGFTVSRVNSGDPRSLAVNVHWWHDGTSAIAVRVLYNIVEDEGVDCSVPGATQDTP